MSTKQPKYELSFPGHFSGYEAEIEAKGYLAGVLVGVSDRSYELTVYDPIRLGQEVADAMRSDGYFAESNLLVVSNVTKAEIVQAVEQMSLGDFGDLVAQG